ETVSIASQLKDLEGFQFHITQNSMPLAEDSLKNYHFVIIHGEMLDMINHQQQRDLERFVLAGGGILGLDLATEYHNKWSWMEQMIAAFHDDLQKPDPLLNSNSEDPDDPLW